MPGFAQLSRFLEVVLRAFSDSLNIAVLVMHELAVMVGKFSDHQFVNKDPCRSPLVVNANKVC